MSVRLAALFSGGKDSNYALYLAEQAGHDVDSLVTILPQEESWMYHVPNVRWSELQSKALGISQIMERAGEGEEEELAALDRALSKTRVDGLIVGAVASDYQFTRVNQVCEGRGLWVYAPMWKKDPRKLLLEYVDAGFRIMIVGVYAERLGKDWLGRELDERACSEILSLAKKHGVHPVGEGGEFETFVLDGPNYNASLEVREAEKVWRGTSGTLHIHDARLSWRSSLASST